MSGGERSSSSSSNSTRAASRKSRVYIFRDFILARYPSLLSSSGNAVVLDCAGGKGDLSWVLRNADGIDSIVLDPRMTKNNGHIVKSIKYLREHPEEARRRSVFGLPTYQPLAALLPKLQGKTETDFVSPRHMRILVDSDLVEAIQYYRRDLMDKDDEWNQYWLCAAIRGREAMPLGCMEDDADTESGQITAAQEALETILSAKLVVGFHPDQATDSAIELAKELDVPYCVVPCCVFPSEHRNRRLADGSRVRCYSELIQYLQEKHAPSIRSENLNFHFAETAKNLALYSL